MMDTDRIIKDFPIFKRRINGKPIVYLDSTATALKPQPVIDAVNDYYTSCTANVFRGIYAISEEATAKYEAARKQVARLIGAAPEEIIFTRNASESLNLVAASWAVPNLRKDDEIVTSIMEHHSDFVPWQQLSQTGKGVLRIWNVGPDGLPEYDALKKLLTPRTRLVAITAASNVLGTLVDIPKVVVMVRTINPGCIVVVDAAQSVPHLPTDVAALGADFVAFSGHKMLGPTGIGVLWGRRELLESMPPYQYGGDMIREVHVDRTVFNGVPHKFEAGTPHIAGAIGMGAAASYLSKLGMQQVRDHEIAITGYALAELRKIKGVHLTGPADPENRGGVVAFTVLGVHPHDVAQILDEDNVCVRVGYHCAQPLHEYLSIGPTVRASFYIYTTEDDIDALVAGLKKVQKLFA